VWVQIAKDQALLADRTFISFNRIVVLLMGVLHSNHFIITVITLLLAAALLASRDKSVFGGLFDQSQRHRMLVGIA